MVKTIRWVGPEEDDGGVDLLKNWDDFRCRRVDKTLGLTYFGSNSHILPSFVKWRDFNPSGLSLTSFHASKECLPPSTRCERAAVATMRHVHLNSASINTRTLGGFYPEGVLGRDNESRVQGMGCSASSPEAVISGISAVPNQSAAGDIGLDVTASKTEEHAALPAVVGNEGETASGTQVEDAKSVEAPKREKTPDDETASNIKAQDSKCDDVGGVDAIIAKKGYVVFEINLDGELDTCLDSSKKPLPKRLKRLEPLPRAPKLTAEELNEKLERAEQKHLKALAMRKSGISRRFEKFAKQASRNIEDAPASEVARSDEAGESESSSTGTSENDTDVTAQTEIKNDAEAPSRLFTSEENDQIADFKQNASAYEIVNLNNNNAISDRGGKTVTSPTPLNVTERYVHGHHMLSAVREVDEENAE